MLDLDEFGAVLRRARERAGLRPIDLAVEMDWSGTAPVYRYERGGSNAPRPDAETIGRFARVLGLDYADRILMLGLAGHIPDTEPLSDREERQLIESAMADLADRREPALIFDYQWRIRAANESYMRQRELLPLTIDDVRERGLTTIDLLWDSEYGGDHTMFMESARMQMLRFQLFNRLRRHERWYREYPARCAHFPGFVSLWQEVDQRITEGLVREELDSVSRGEFAIQRAEGREVRFTARQQTIHGAYGLLGMLVLEPVDSETGSWIDRGSVSH